MEPLNFSLRQLALCRRGAELAALLALGRLRDTLQPWAVEGACYIMLYFICVILYHVVLYCIVWCCIVLYCTVLYCIVSYIVRYHIYIYIYNCIKDKTM